MTAIREMGIRAYISGLLIILLCGGLQAARAQTTSLGTDPSRTFPPVSISMSGLYQSRTYENTDIYEMSSGVSARMQLMPNLGATLAIYQATVEHDSLQRISGLADIQVTITYVARLNRSRIIAGVASNLPTGKSYLSRWAYDASFPMGLSHYDFSVPFFSQGTTISPSLGWVYSASPSFVIGLGATYRLRESYEPHRQLPGKYEWGNELSFSANAEWNASPTFSLNGGIIFTLYDADKIEDVIVYTAGNRVVLQVGLFKKLGRNDLWLDAVYRNVGTNQILFNSSLLDEPVKATPGGARVSLRYRLRVHRIFRATFGASAKHYTDTFEIQAFRGPELIRFDAIRNLDQLDVFSVSFNPEISLAPSLTIPIQLDYFMGDLEGFNAGVGLTAIL